MKNFSIGLMCCLSLGGCATIPQPPERQTELCRQCADWNYRQSVKLNDAVKEGASPSDILELSNPLEWGSEAVRDWVGKPYKEFNGDIKKLVLEMDEEDSKYRKEIADWKSEVMQHSGKRVSGGNFWKTTLTLLTLGGVGLWFVVKKFIII